MFIILLITFCGCNGGGGGGDNDTPDELLFTLRPANYYQPGHKSSYKIKGSSTAGAKLEGDYITNTKNKISVNNNLLTPIDESVDLTNTINGAIVRVFTTTFYDSNKNPVVTTNSEGISAAPISIAVIPETATIGTIGPLTSWVYEDGNTATGNWSLESHSGSLADLVSMQTIKNSFGNIIAYQELISTINTSGEVQSIEIKWYYPETEITINLQGTKA